MYNNYDQKLVMMMKMMCSEFYSALMEVLVKTSANVIVSIMVLNNEIVGKDRGWLSPQVIA